MSVEGEEYVEGDVNTVDDYEDGDINAIDVDVDVDDDDDYENDEVDDEANESGNRSDGGTPTAVLNYLARSLANEPESVVVQTEERQGTVRLRLHVAPEDMGRVIGRRGRTAQAIRTLVGVAGARDGVQTSVDIVDD